MMRITNEIKALHTSGLYAGSGNDTIKTSIINIILLPFTILIKCILFVFKSISFILGNNNHTYTSSSHYYSGTRRKPLSNDERLKIFSGRLAHDKNDPTVPKELRDKLNY